MKRYLVETLTRNPHAHESVGRWTTANEYDPETRCPILLTETAADQLADTLRTKFDAKVRILVEGVDF